jgi:serine protease Do/serine protease DegQ
MLISLYRTSLVRTLGSSSLTLLAALAATGLHAQPLPTLAPMIERVSPAVVNISVSGHIAALSPLAEMDPLFRRFFDVPENPEREFQSAGSGVIVDAEAGYILTNHHVIENAEQITITLLDQRVLEARVVGSDSASDIAVVQIDAANLAEIEFGDSNALRVGDFVVAIGNPFGFSNTVTSGIVSGLGRNRVSPDPDAREDFIQTDAAINLGNSGGALVNLDGKLVGINSAIVSQTGGNIGIGFAIPATMARNVMNQLIQYGEVSRGLLGVVISSITPDFAATYGLTDTRGALVTEVTPGSAAEAAGLQINDVIVTINGEPVRDSGALRNMIGLMRPDEEIRIGLVRDSQQRFVTARLSKSEPAAANTSPAPPEPAGLDPSFEGVELAENQSGSGISGLVVLNVDAESLAAEVGLRAGDVITYINRQRVRSFAEAQQIVADARTITLQVQRGSRSLLILMR